MNDMSSVIIPRSDQINADSLLAGPITITINKVSISAGSEQPVRISYLNDDGKAWRPCKSMSRVLVAAWGPDANNYIGRSVTLYLDPEVKWGGMAVGGIRISHMSDIDREMVMALTQTKGKKAPFVVKPLAAQADKVADGVRTLIDRIRAGEDVTADAAATKQRAWLAKNRPELAADVDAAIASARAGDDDPFAECKPEEDMGEAHVEPAEDLFEDPRQAKADEIIAAVGAVTTKAELETLKEQYGPDIDAMPDELLPLVAGALDGAGKRVK
jgi:hypothetical protein